MWMRRVCWNSFNKSLVSVVHEYQLVQSQVCTEPDWCLLKICQGKLPWYNILINSCSNTHGEWFHVGCCDNHCQHHSSPMITSNWTTIKTYHRYSVRNCFHNRNNTLECHVYINNFMFSLSLLFWNVVPKRSSNITIKMTKHIVVCVENHTFTNTTSSIQTLFNKLIVWIWNNTILIVYIELK